jgi:Na+/H+ antiporter NhaC
MLGEILTGKLQAMSFPAVWAPFAIAVVAYLISFSTGTSWGTMGILCPIAIPMAVGLVRELPADQALTLFYASVGSVLGGAIFGDHCSPLSSTTVLAAIGADCSLVEHTWTQFPYAVLSGVVALACGDIACSVYGQPWYVGLFAGASILFVVVLVLGRRAKPSFAWVEGHAAG